MYPTIPPPTYNHLHLTPPSTLCQNINVNVCLSVFRYLVEIKTFFGWGTILYLWICNVKKVENRWSKYLRNCVLIHYQIHMLRHRNSTEFNFWQTSVFSNLPIPLRWLFRVSKISTIQPTVFDSTWFDISFRTIQNFSQIRVLFLNSFFELKLSISIKQTFTRYKSFRFCNCTQGICFKSKTTFFLAETLSWLRHFKSFCNILLRKALFYSTFFAKKFTQNVADYLLWTSSLGLRIMC